MDNIAVLRRDHTLLDVIRDGDFELSSVLIPEEHMSAARVIAASYAHATHLVDETMYIAEAFEIHEKGLSGEIEPDEHYLQMSAFVNDAIMPDAIASGRELADSLDAEIEKIELTRDEARIELTAQLASSISRRFASDGTYLDSGSLYISDERRNSIKELFADQEYVQGVLEGNAYIPNTQVAADHAIAAAAIREAGRLVEELPDNHPLITDKVRELQTGEASLYRQELRSMRQEILSGFNITAAEAIEHHVPEMSERLEASREAAIEKLAVAIAGDRRLNDKIRDDDFQAASAAGDDFERRSSRNADRALDAARVAVDNPEIAALFSDGHLSHQDIEALQNIGASLKERGCKEEGGELSCQTLPNGISSEEIAASHSR